MKQTKQILAFVLALAIILSSVSLPVQRVKASDVQTAAETDAGSSSDFDYIFDQIENTKKVCQAILDLPVSVRSYYAAFTSVQKIARNVIYNDKTEFTQAEKKSITDFVFWCYKHELKTDNLFSAGMRKLGVFFRSIADWFRLLKGTAEEIVNQFSALLDNDLVNKPVENNKTYKLTRNWMNSVKRVSDKYIENEKNKYFFEVGTLSWAEAGDLSEEIAEDFDKWLYIYEEGLQYALDNFGDSDSYFYVLARTPIDHNSQYQHFMIVTDIGDSPYLSSVYNGKFCVSICPTNQYPLLSKRYFNGSSSQLFKQSEVSVGWVDYFGYSSWTSDIQFPFFNNDAMYKDTYNVAFIIQKDKKPIKIFRSKELADQFNSTAYPYGYYVSGSYNTYNTQNGNSYTVGGDFINNSNTENDYSTINNTVINNNYVGDTINNVVNDYHTEINGGGGTGGDNGDGDQGGGGGGSGDGSGNTGGNGISSFLEGARSFINAVLELIGGILDIVGDLFSGLIGALRSFTVFKDDFGDFLGANMTFIPAEAIAVIVAGITAMVVVGVIKLFFRR